MKPKIITGNETVGYYWSSENKIRSKTYNELSEDEQKDYLTEDDERKYIYIDTPDANFDLFIELFYSKESLIESKINDIIEKINVQTRVMKNTSDYIIKLQNDMTKYIEMKSRIMLGE